MCPAHIAFSTPKKPKFTWTDTFEDLENAELEQLIIECRGALHSLEAELAARQNPRVDTKLEDCYARLQEKVRTINNMGSLSNKDRASLEEAGTFLEALRSGHIDSSQTRETRRVGAMYEQLLWLISRVAGPAYALLLICSVARRTVERLNSFQSAILVKRVARYCDSLSSRALEEKANEFSLYADATSLIQRTSGKRKLGQSDNRVRSIARTNPELISNDKSVPSNVGDKYGEMEPAGVTLLTSYHPGEVDGVSPPETGLNSGILTPVSEAVNNDDTNGMLALPHNAMCKRTCMVHPAAKKHSTSSIMSAYCSPAFSGHLYASTFSDVVDQAGPSNQVSVATTAAAYQSYTIDPASQALATLLSFLGQSRIPERLLERARGPLLTWGENGEVAIQNVNTVEVVQDKIMCEKAVCDLHQLKAIHLDQSTVKTRYILVEPQLLTQIAHDKDHMKWKTEAVKVVLYAFPIDRRLEPLYSFSIATSILPLLKHVLPFLEEIDVQKALPTAYVIEVCLSASYYSTLDWKSNVIAAAESIGTRFPVSAQLRERLELRKRILSRISSCKWGSEMERLEFPRVDQRSNGYYGEFVLFNADIFFERQQLQAALHELDGYTPWQPGNVSTLEQIQICEMGVLRGKIHHFSGHFIEARRYLERALHARRPEVAIMSKAMAHLTAVCCELGETKIGIKYASAQLDDLTAYQSRESGSAKRLRLALAYAYLMQGMWVIFTQPTAFGYTSLRRDIRQGFDKAHELFQLLAQSYENASALSRAGKTNRFSALLGLALIAHIRDDMHGARDRYDIALDAASHCQWDAGYAEAIIYWSKSVVMHNLGELEEAQKLNLLAGKFYQCRSYFFAGFGTLWPEIIGTWVAQQGRERIIPQQGWERTSPEQ